MRRADSAPAFSADFVSIMVSSVEFEPVPAMTGTLLLAISMGSSITLLCSSYERVADSPVVPQGTRPEVPFDIWNSMSLLNAASSTRPSLNGVTRAVIEPVNIIPPNRLLKKSICYVVFVARRCDVHEEYDSLIKRRELPCIWSFLSSLDAALSKDLNLCYPCKYLFRGACHVYMVVLLRPFDVEPAAAKEDRYLAARVAFYDRGDRGSRSAGAAGKRLSCAALPDPHLYLVLGKHLYELDIGLLREELVYLYHGAVLLNRKCIDLVDVYDAVRVAHRDAGYLKGPVVYAYLPVHYLTLGERGYEPAFEYGLAHVDPDELAYPLGPDYSGKRFYVEAVLPRELV